ncbi:MAG: dihydroorotate dehydrogenase electron transfer subunit [Phycisphaerae bacterium]|nr:dihydroorotate dehydrogenase electron transfer subunit [Phycisphaerae bacterium]
MAGTTIPKSSAKPLRLAVLDTGRMGEDFASLSLAAPEDFESLPGQLLNIRAAADWDEMTAHAGQPADIEDAWPRLRGEEITEPRPLVSRPLSIARVWRDDAGRKRIELVFRIVGKGTRFLAARRPGDVLDAVGPLGNHFSILPGDTREAVLVAGGCGIAPMTALAEKLKAARRSVVCILGCKSIGNMPANLSQPVLPHGEKLEATSAVREFSQFGFSTLLSTDDGTAGYHGLATDVLEKYLCSVESPADDLVIYCCGPHPMMKPVARMAIERGIFCEVSLEEYMGCGIGVCLSCACKVRDETKGEGWTHRLTCTDGPVLRADEIIWE